MSDGPGKRLAEEITERLDKHGVSDYVLIFRDPDSNSDWMKSKGSLYWLIGAATDLLDESKEQSSWKRERQGLDDEAS